MKILCVIDSLGSGGAQRQLVGLAKKFTQRGHDVAFLVYHKIDFFKNELDEAGIQVYAVIEPNYLKRLFKMRRFIRKGNYDAVLSFLEASGFICEFAGLPFRRWRLIVGERSANPNIKKSLKKRFYRWFHLFAGYVVANSQSNINIVRKINPLLAKRKCRVIYNMVDLYYWKPDPVNYEFRKNGNVNMVIFASHRFLKNLNGLVEAVNLLSETDKQLLKIRWYGSLDNDNSKTLAQEKIKKYGLEETFEFFKPVLDVRSVIYQADAVGLFSFYEGLPNVVCEAMACGKPVVVSAVSDIPGLLKDGINAYICNANDYASISTSLRNLIRSTENDLLQMGSENYRQAKILFSPDNIIDNYLNLLNKP
jgi:glycosyltransferase involved in cell wall biosynthesis